MRLAVAQVRPIVGQVEANLDRHLALLQLAVGYRVKLMIFPELSLTGYQPARAAELARFPDDPCFAQLQSACNHGNIAAGVGVPLRTNHLPHISTLVFRPHAGPLVYSKKYLHPDEAPFITPGFDPPTLILTAPAVALAICYELSVPQHAQDASTAGADAYVASVAKTAPGIMQASRRLSDIGAEYSMPVLMSNCLGYCDGAECTGCSSAWDRNGRLMAQLDAEHEGIIVFDIATGDVVTATLSRARP